MSELSSADVLRDVSDALEPPRLLELFDGLVSLENLKVPNVTYEVHEHSDYSYYGGRVTLPVIAGRLTISSLQEVDWSQPLEGDSGVMINALADQSGNRHPRLLIISYAHLQRRLGGQVKPVNDPESLGWLQDLVRDLGVADDAVDTFWNRPRNPPEGAMSRVFDQETGQWVVVDRAL